MTFHVNEKPIFLSGMAHPIDYAIEGKNSFQTLKDTGHKTMISLDDRKEEIMEESCRTNSIERIVSNVKDFTPPSEDQYKEIYDIVKKSTDPVVIHCGEGYGRTGSVLAGIMIQAALENMTPNQLLNHNTENRTCSIQTGHYDGNKTYQVSDLVYSTIINLRSLTKAPPSTNGDSVENGDQINSLLELESSLVNQYKKDFETELPTLIEAFETLKLRYQEQDHVSIKKLEALSSFCEKYKDPINLPSFQKDLQELDKVLSRRRIAIHNPFKPKTTYKLGKTGLDNLPDILDKIKDVSGKEEIINKLSSMRSSPLSPSPSSTKGNSL
jgi:hypothetical protein